MSNFVVDVTVSSLSSSVAVASFDTVAIFSNDTPIANIAKGDHEEYSSLSDIGTDWGTASNTYKQASAGFAQSPGLKKILVYRREDASAQTKVLVKTGNFVTGNVIAWNVNGISGTVNYNTSSVQTYTDLATAIATASAFVATAVASGDNLTITSQVGANLDINVSCSGGVSQPTFVVNTSTAGWTISDDIADAITNNLKFYWLMETSHAKATQNAMAQTAQANKKYAIFSTNEANAITSNTSDIVSLLSAKNYSRTAIFYSATSNTEYIEDALLGRCIPIGNGQVTFKLKRLNGVTADNLTGSQRTFLENKNGNYFVENGGVNITYPGVSSDGSPIEFIWDIDYFEARLTEAIYSLLVSVNKLDYSDVGINQVGAVIDNIVQQMINERIFKSIDDNGNPPKVTIPTIASIPQADKNDYILSGFAIEAEYLPASAKVKVNVNVLI